MMMSSVRPFPANWPWGKLCYLFFLDPLMLFNKYLKSNFGNSKVHTGGGLDLKFWYAKKLYLKLWNAKYCKHMLNVSCKLASNENIYAERLGLSGTTIKCPWALDCWYPGPPMNHNYSNYFNRLRQWSSKSVSCPPCCLISQPQYPFFKGV